MYRQTGHEPGTVFVGLENRGRGTVFPHRAQNLRYPGRPPLGQVELLEKLTDAAVAVAAAYGAPDLQLIHTD